MVSYTDSTVTCKLGQQSSYYTLALHPHAHCWPHSQEALFTSEDASIQLSASNAITDLAHTVSTRPIWPNLGKVFKYYNHMLREHSFFLPRCKCMLSEGFLKI